MWQLKIPYAARKIKDPTCWRSQINKNFKIKKYFKKEISRSFSCRKKRWSQLRKESGPAREWQLQGARYLKTLKSKGQEQMQKEQDGGVETQQKGAYVLKFYLWTLLCPLRPDPFFSGSKDPIPSVCGRVSPVQLLQLSSEDSPQATGDPCIVGAGSSKCLKVYSYPCRLIIHDCLVGQSDIQLLCLEEVKTLRYNLYSKCPTRLVQDFS